MADWRADPGDYTDFFLARLSLNVRKQAFDKHDSKKKEIKMKTQIKKDQIEEALELLNAAAQEKKEEVFELLGDKYEHLKEFFESAAHNGAAIAGQTKEQIAKSLHQEEKKLKEVAAELDEKVHKDPWAFMGGVALGSLVLGLILGRKK